MNFKKFFTYFLLLFSFLFNATYAQEIEFPEDKVKYEIKLEKEGCEAFVIADIKVVEGWHINAAHLPFDCFSIPTLLDIESSSNYIIGDSTYEPESHHIYDSLAKEDLYLHDGALIIKRKIKIHHEK